MEKLNLDAKAKGYKVMTSSLPEKLFAKNNLVDI
jgi:hypothetical protein